MKEDTWRVSTAGRSWQVMKDSGTAKEVGGARASRFSFSVRSETPC